MHPSLRAIAIAFYVVATVSVAGAGTTGGISGHVRYVGGKPIAGLAVWVCSAAQVAVATTNSDGFYSFVSLAPGTYSMHLVSHATYPASIAAIRVTADDTTTQDSHVCALNKICGDSFGLSRPLEADTSADVGNFDADDVDRWKSCGSAW